MEKRILQYIDEKQLLEAGDAVLIGVSGGADSLALLHFLNQYKDQLGIQIAVAHVHHGLRGEDADLDAAFVKEQCRKLGVSFYLKETDVHVVARETGKTLEDAGRAVRRSFFKTLTEQKGFSKIALAHHLNDQAETVLMRLIRGTGVKGASGMASRIEAEGMTFIRPMLCVTKKEICEYCEAKHLMYRTDATNFEEIATRNRIRLSLMPALEAINPRVQQHLSEFSQLAGEYEDFFETAVEQQAKTLIKINGNRASLDIEGWKKCHPLMQKALLRKCLGSIKGSLKEIEYNHILNLQRLLCADKTTWSLMLPEGFVGVRRYEDFWIERQKTTREKVFGDYPLPRSGRVYFSSEGLCLELRVFFINNLKELKNSDEKYFDYGKIKEQLHFRSRKTGDFFYQKGMKGRRKLKAFFIDRKIDRDLRDRIPLLAEGSEIIWCPGYFTNVAYQPNEQTVSILGVRLLQIEKQSHEEYVE